MILNRLALVFTIILVSGQTLGCTEVDWHWDLDWWQKPSRIVRPNPAATPTLADQQTAPPTHTQEPPDRPPRNSISQPVPNAPTPADASSRDARPFYHLYLLSGNQPAPEPLDELHHRLKSVDARSCARLVEMLHVPMGRSGSVDETYLLFEERDEFDAAKRAAIMLDIKPHTDPAPSISHGMTFETAVALFYQIINQGAIVDRKLIDQCGRHLTEAIKSPQLADQKRWAAAILAGRLLSEFRYDYVTARRFYDEAERFARPGSIEQMTVDWWRADALVQQGAIREGNAVYEDLLDTHAQRWPRSQIITRSRAILKENRKRS